MLSVKDFLISIIREWGWGYEGKKQGEEEREEVGREKHEGEKE